MSNIVGSINFDNNEGFWERAAARLVVEKQQLKEEVAKLKQENKELRQAVELRENPGIWLG